MPRQFQLSRRALLLLAYFMFFVMAIPTGILNVAWTYMQASFSVSLDSLGILLLASTCGGLLGSFFSGRFIGRFGVGWFLMGGSLLAVLGLFGFTVAPAFPVLLGSIFLLALGFSTFNAGLNFFISANYTTGQLNWLHAGFGLGVTVGPALTTLLVERLGQSWHLPYLIMLVIVAAVSALLWLSRAQWVMVDDLPAASPQPVERISLWESLQMPVVVFGILLFIILNGTIGGTGQLSTTLLTSRGVAEANAGFWVSLYWASFTIGRVIMGFIAHRLDHSRLITFCILGAGIGALFYAQTASIVLNLFGLALIGFSCAPLYPTLIALTRQRVAQRHRANAIGFQITAGSIGSTLLPGIFAWLAEHTSVAVIGVLPLVGMTLALTLYQISLRRQERVRALV